MARFWEIDAFRGLAIILMIIFHFLWDLKYFGYIHFDLYSGFWGVYQVATAGLFLLLAGLVITLNAHKHGKDYPIHFLKRGGFIFGCGLLVTIATYIFFPNELVYFGILQLIGVSIILSIPLAKRKVLPLILAVIFIALPMLINLQQFGINFLVWVGLAVPNPTLDFEPLFPWFGAFLLGIFIGNWCYGNNKRIFSLVEGRNWLSNKLQFLGKHSLVIYLLHQIIIFGAIYAVTFIL